MKEKRLWTYEREEAMDFVIDIMRRYQEIQKIYLKRFQNFGRAEDGIKRRRLSMGISNQSNLNMVCEEVAKLEWINRALKQQISFNENRLAELDKELWELKRAKDGNNN